MATSWTKLPDNTASWANVPKPSPVTSIITKTFTGGDPIGLLLALTYSQVAQSSVLSNIWTNIPKGQGTTYTNIAKAT
jgi:O6-methylguanine-DNA--protein-cysteine methyltransferase